MNLEKSTILITGGSAGIGLALAKRFVKAGSAVIICGRKKDQLELAKKSCPELSILQSDVSTEEGRLALVKSVTEQFPKLNVLINNAGIQNRLPPLTEAQDWHRHKEEIAINLEAPMHLSMLFIDHLKRQAESSIMNVSSGLAFSPVSLLTTYCCTKAALHSFTLSLRHALKETPIKVVEIIPPAVNTDLGGKGLHTMGVPLDAFADHAFAKIVAGELEFGYETSEKRRLASRAELDAYFAAANR